MMASTSTLTGCGSAQCACTEGQSPPAVAAPAATASINGVALHAEGERLPAQVLQERAYGELLRQHAVASGCLPALPCLQAPELSETDRQAIEALLDREVISPAPSEEECRRYFEANRREFSTGQAVHMRHILFAVTPGVNVHALTVEAEKALLELLRKDVHPDRFGQLAAQLSNCPSSTQGGNLGWVGPHDCAPELVNELFQQKNSQWGLGVHPRLVHTRFGFHIIEVLGRRKGKPQPYEAVEEAIRVRLSTQSRARALHQYMSLLVGQARIEGLVLEGAASPLVQ